MIPIVDWFEWYEFKHVGNRIIICHQWQNTHLRMYISEQCKKTHISWIEYMLEKGTFFYAATAEASESCTHSSIISDTLL